MVWTVEIAASAVELSTSPVEINRDHETVEKEDTNQLN
jgi:hypothetical protein